MLISCFNACDMSCALYMPTIFTHAMITMIPSSTLHLRTTRLFDLITMISCFVASPMFHSYSPSWVDDIYIHASHVIYLDHCLLSSLVAPLICHYSECTHAMLIYLGDLGILLVKRACLIKPNVFGCNRIICFHFMPHLVLSYVKNDENTCWVFHHTNDRFCFQANLICFSECLPCSFVLKELHGTAITRHIGYVKVCA